MRKVILTCAVTGNITRPEQTPYLPITPGQIADACLEAAAEGAAIVHVHVRHPDGRPSMELAHYQEVVERIRSRNARLLLNLTTGPGQRYVPSRDHPGVPDPATNLLPPARRILASGVKPELELFGAGDVLMARDLMAQIEFPSPLMVSFVMGVKYGWPATVETLQLARSLIPPGTVWTGFGVGRDAFPMVAQSVLLGGHVRVGLEDNIYLERGVLAPGNGALCAKAARLVRDLGCELASPDEARTMLGIP